MIQDICKTQNSGGSGTKKAAPTSQVRDSHARTAEGAGLDPLRTLTGTLTTIVI